MAGEKIPDDVQINSKLQKPHPLALSPAEKERARRFGTTAYKPEYAELCFELLSEADRAKNKSHCCALLQCSKPCLIAWMKKFPEFHRAINEGLEIGKSKWYSKLADHAFEPSQKVNNGLIKLLSSNVYGINAEPEVALTVNNISEDPEKIMKRKGIPIPEIDIDDVEE